MPNLVITEFDGDGVPLTNGQIPSPVACYPAEAEQAVAIAVGSNNRSVAFSARTRIIRVKAQANCCITVGPGTPTATANSAPLDEGEREYFFVAPGDVLAVLGV